MAKSERRYVYVSVTPEDYPCASNYISSLEKHGYCVKSDPSTRIWSSRNAKAIDNCSVFVAFFSETSADDAKVMSEVNYACAHNIPVISVCLDDIKPTKTMRQAFSSGPGSAGIINAHNGSEEASRLLRSAVSSYLGFQVSKPVKIAVATCATLFVVLMTALALIITSDETGIDTQSTSQIVQKPVQAMQETDDLGSVGSVAEIAKAESLTITVHSPFGKNDPSSESYLKLLKAYDSSFDNLEIKDMTVNYDNYSSALMSFFESESLPDVFVFDYSLLNNMTVAQRNLIADVDTIRTNYSSFAGNIYSGAVESVRDPLTKKCYAIPVRGYWEGLFCNTDLFTANNVELPTDWDKLTAAIQVFSENEIVPISASVGIVSNYLTDHLILATAGLDEFNSTPATYSEVPSSWVSGLDYFKTLFDMKAFPQNTDTLFDAETTDLFIQKKAALKVDGSWLCSSLTNVTDVTVIQFPATSQAKTTTSIIGGYSNGWAISRTAWNDPKKREYCVNFVNYMTSEKNLGKFVLVNGAPSGSFEASNNDTLVHDGIRLVETALSDGNRFAVPLKERYSNINTLYDNAYSVATGEMTAQDALQSVF